MDSLVAAAVFGRRRRRGSHGKPAFDPRTLPGLAFWYHPAASDVVKDDATGKVSRLIDLSGNGNDATQFTAANELTWEAAGLAGAPGIRCASPGSMAGPIVDITAGFTFSFQCVPQNVTAEQGLCEIANGSASNRLTVFQSTTGQVAVHVFSAQTTWIGRRSVAGALANGVKTTITVTWDGTPSSNGIQIYVNGALVSSGADSNGAFTVPTAPTIPFVVGSASGGNNGFFSGVLGDMLLCRSVLASADRSALDSALLGTTPLYVPPTPAPKFSGNVYVATTGKATAAGTQADPIDQATLLSAGVPAGTTVVVRGGTYGDWESFFSGTAANPIVIQAFPGEHVIIDGNYKSNGDYVYLTDSAGGWMELTNSDTARVSTQTSDNPTDITRGQIYPYLAGKFNKLINVISHDHGNGVYAPGEGCEFLGCIFYNNGWEGPTPDRTAQRGLGKSMYLQNAGANKIITDCVAFGAFSSNIQMFGTGDASILGYQYTGCAIFGASTPTPTLTVSNREEMDLTGATDTTRGDVTVDSCSIYQADAIMDTTNVVRFNAAGDVPGQAITFTNNIVRGHTASFNEDLAYTVTGNTFDGSSTALDGQNVLIEYRQGTGVALTDNSWDTNTYSAVTGTQLPFYYKGDGTPRDFADWQTATGFDATSTYTEGTMTGSQVIVRANANETGRAHIICWNWDGAASLNADLSTVLTVGDVYSVWHVYDLFGTPVISSATYDGNPVSLTQTGYTAPTPTGYGTTPASTAPYFNVFLVRKVA